MKLAFVSLLLVSTGFLMIAVAGDAKVTYIAHDKVAKGGTLISTSGSHGYGGNA